jgi:hypothetical protein
MQGEQIDKLLREIRKSIVGEDNMWDAVMEACGFQDEGRAAHIKSTGRKWSELFELFTWLYDCQNKVDEVNEFELHVYKSKVARFNGLFAGDKALKLNGVLSGREVTPYVHILVCHSHAYLKEYRSLRPLSQEGFEAAHKRTKQFYLKTNLGGGKNGDEGSAYKQILLKVFRHQHLDLKMKRGIKNLNAMDRAVNKAKDTVATAKLLAERAQKRKASEKWRIKKAHNLVLREWACARGQGGAHLKRFRASLHHSRS